MGMCHFSTERHICNKFACSSDVKPWLLSIKRARSINTAASTAGGGQGASGNTERWLFGQRKQNIPPIHRP